MLWGTLGTYRTAVGAGKISSPAHARTRENQVGGVIRLATELLPNDSLTWHRLLPIGNIFCGVAADRTATTRPNFVSNWTHFCAMVAVDRTTTERPSFVSNWRQIRAVVDSYSAARWSLRCFEAIEATDPI
jgi:hypothetical protein